MAGWVQKNHCFWCPHALSHQMGKYYTSWSCKLYLFRRIYSFKLERHGYRNTKIFLDGGLNGINKVIKVLASFIEYADYPIKLSAYGRA